MAEPPHTLTHDGKTYQARRIDGKMKKEWAKWLFRSYRELERETREDITPEEYRDNLAALDDLFFAGEFGLLSLRGVKAMQTPDGAFQLSCLIFCLGEEDMLALMAALPEEVAGLIGTIMRESFPMDQKAGPPDPKVKPPAPGFVPLRRRASEPSAPSSATTSASTAMPSTP